MSGLGPEIVFLDANGKRRAGLGMGADGGLFLNDSNSDVRAFLGLSKGTGSLSFFDADGKMRVLLDERSLELSDKEGFETTIGTTDLLGLRTGETRRTSAASVVLFDKDKKVLWEAP